MPASIHRLAQSFLAVLAAVLFGATTADASDFAEPWKRADRALVIDAYEYNPIDWQNLARDKRIAGFINKASDGLSPPYKCSGDETEIRLCKALWKRHAVARELFHTRRTVAKALGLKWGAYHLGRPGNPIDQANNFIDFAEPGPDDLIALDIEDNDPEKWMSLEEAEAFARHIHTRLGRWPVLYTNGSTALHIAENSERYGVLSRLPLWYARYKPTIGLHFPKGYWQTYALWQFAAGANCDARSCPYRVPGTPLDIDVNVASMSVDELRAVWPFGELVDKTEHRTAETVPLPVARRNALEGGDVTVQFARVEEGEAPEIADGQETEAEIADARFASVEPAVTSALLEDAGPQFEIAELTVESDETVPLPIWRSEARKKGGDVTLKFVSVERVVAQAAATKGLPSVAPAGVRGPPFQALLGERPKAALPVELVGYAQVAEKARQLGVATAPSANLGAPPIPSGNISTAAVDDPGPIVSAARYSRRDLPVFLLRKLDGPDEPSP